ncbi:hypothetical protein ALI144C_19640 [Actinosynnema sp. ALI-1.44]|uniref:phage tail protein n=1 Tax=Actinosynnema sp. ALI-1.44 TaxID=1933779 RepID=UPI00097C3659|nr:phage tail protein [Actinosynnema sp. ALI-1.44]ONI81529.1 hypothetical protein ALI144C_19640 [Actinosynnema sp. ALI-1.44]
MSAPAFGLTIWFDVSVLGLGPADDHQLGQWSSCTGLGVEFGTEEFGEGGRYDSPAVLPGRIKYTRITLQRAVSTADSPRVQRWLERVAAQWVNSGRSAAEFAGVELVIKLRDSPSSDGPVIQEWRLRNAIPVSWNGPALSATGGGVATEQLVLVHQGFLTTKTDDSAAHATGADGRLRLASATDASKKIVFQYTPETVKLSRKHEVRSLSSNPATELNLTRPARLGISLGQLRVDGAAQVRTAIGLLSEWMQPVSSPPLSSSSPGQPSDSESGSDDKSYPALQRLRLTLGSTEDGIIQDVILTSMDVTYDRFTSAGDPCRAQVALNLEEFRAAGGGEQPAAASTTGDTPAQRLADTRKSPT